MSFSPIIRVRRLLEKMRAERSDSPRSSRKSNIERSGSSSSSYPSSPKLDWQTPAQERSRMFNSKDGRLVWWHGQNQFERIPDESVMLIFSFLESNDLLQARLVNHQWSHFADDNLVWKNLCMSDWNIDEPLYDTWKETYNYLEELFSEGVWEGMSKWIEPAGFDNEQKTTAKLQFLKRAKRGNHGHSNIKSTTSTIHRVDSTPNAIDRTEFANFKESNYRIQGTGVTINCAAPSPFQIEGERVESDPTGTTFKWHKHFEKHTSVYTGTLVYATGSVSGEISYHDGTTLWKGVFSYKKVQKSAYMKYFNNQVMA